VVLGGLIIIKKIAPPENFFRSRHWSYSQALKVPYDLGFLGLYELPAQEMG